MSCRSTIWLRRGRFTATRVPVERFVHCANTSAPACKFSRLRTTLAGKAIAFGDFEEVSDGAQRTTILRQLLDRFPELTPVESYLAREGEWEAIVFCLRIDRVTGVAED